jgi:hypothetical protein
MRGIGALLAIGAIASAVAGCNSATTETNGSNEATVTTGVSFWQNQYGVTFTNTAADWIIYKGCWGPTKRHGTNLTVGPGYIARVILKTPSPTGNVLLNDEAPAKDENGGTIGFTHPGFAGLGGFAWHHSRGQAPYTFDFNNAWELAGRVCAEDHGGFGVSGAQVTDGPRIDTDGSGVLGIDVDFTDGWTTNRPLLTVRYLYRVYPTSVTMWAQVVERCDGGDCGSGTPGPAYIGEPKFVAAINGAGGGYHRLAMFDDQDHIGTNQMSRNARCFYTKANPYVATGQCDDVRRVRAQFDYATDDSDDGLCDADHPCLNTVMQAYSVDADGKITPGHDASLWNGSPDGLDAWARLSATREAVNAVDSPSGGAQWSCHGASTALQQNRRWELVGLSKDDQDQYTNATFYFHGWESGTGAYDCEPHSRRFGPDGESFAVTAEFSLRGLPTPMTHEAQ